MELVYLWVENYKNIHKQGFNFSPNLVFDFKYEYVGSELKNDCSLLINNKEELENKDLKKIISINLKENFFNKNINLNVIVGKNGTGKSSIINILEDLFILKRLGNNIFVFLYDNELCYVSNIKIKTKMKKITIEDFDFMSYNAENPYPDKQRMNYHSLDDDNYSEYDFIDNDEDLTVSFNSNNILLKSIDKNILMGEDITSFMLKPNKFFIKSFNNEMFVNNIIDKLENYDFKKYGFNYSTKDIQYYFLDYLVDDIEILIKIDYVIVNRKMNKILKEISDKYMKIYQDMNLIDNVDDLDNVDDEITIEIFFKEFKNYCDIYETTEELITLIDLINDEFFLLSELTDNIKDMIFNQYTEYFKLDFEDIKNRKFSDLSHGEKSIYGLMVNLKYKIMNSERSKFLFCLDEPDISLHPEWQRKFISELFKYINNQNVEIHFIITTHSPFILSDIPKKNILFFNIDKNDNIEISNGLKELKETFGANIHTLLSDGFFMENGLMGEFAKDKISQILFLLSNKIGPINIPTEQIKPIIEIIGENFLREKLLKMYDEKFKIKSKDDEIKELKAGNKELIAEIERLKNAKNNS